MAMRHRIIDLICLSSNGFYSYWLFVVLWHNSSHGVRSQLPQRLESTCSCTNISPRDTDALLRSFVSSMEYSPRMIVLCWLLHCNGDFVALAAENSLHVHLSQLFADPQFKIYNLEWRIIFEWLDGTVEAFLIAAWALKRTVLVDSLT